MYVRLGENRSLYLKETAEFMPEAEEVKKKKEDNNKT